MARQSTQHTQYQRIAEAIHFLRTHQQQQPSLSEVAAHLSLSPAHLQRIFQQWAGVSPKQFLQYLTRQHAKQVLRREPVLQAALSCGLSGSSRLHDLMIRWDSVTPGEYRRCGHGLSIRWGIHTTPFGWCLLAVTKRGLCQLSFLQQPDEGDAAVDAFLQEWSLADLQRDDQATESVRDQVFGPGGRGTELIVLLRGSEFQLAVWEALIRIPPGELRTYQQVAVAAGCPTAVRAAASAVGRNQIAYLIPCHRVIRGTGETGQYRWGSERKAAMIAWEAGQHQDQP